MNETAHTYRELLPPPELRDQFLCLWTQSIGETRVEYSHRVLPDGCIDLVFVNRELPVVVGPWTEPFVARFSRGTTLVGARWICGRSPGLLALPPSELLNQSAPLSALWGDRSSTEFAPVIDRATVGDGLSSLARALIRRVACTRATDPLVHASVRWLADHPNGRIAALSGELGVSRRHLLRRFVAAVGYGPKTFQSVLRLQRLLYLARTVSSLPRLAIAAGYVDQAHMAHDVRRLAGTTAAELLRSAECTVVPILQDAEGAGH